MPKKEKLCPQLKVGWVNIQKVPNGGMFTGADIHETEELAKKHASANTITQTRIEFTVK